MAIGAITLNNGVSDVPLNPVNKTGNLIIFRDPAAVTSRTASEVAVDFTPRTSRRRSDRIEIRYTVPHVITVDGEVTSRDNCFMKIQVVIPEGIPADDRVAFRHMSADLVDQFAQYIDDLVPFLS
jgi:hypothetical protein